MRGRKHMPQPTLAPDDDAVELSVRLISGHFESSITVPLTATDAERSAFINAWLGLMDAGIKGGKEKRDAELAAKTQFHACCGYAKAEGHNASCVFFGEPGGG